jgi:hypothetical protein
MLTELGHREYSRGVEHAQTVCVEPELKEALARIEPVYLTFLDYFRSAVNSVRPNKLC